MYSLVTVIILGVLSYLAKNVNHITTLKGQLIRKTSSTVPQTLVKIGIISASIS